MRAIAQGSSERNISVVIDRDHSTRALRAVHSGFYLADQTLSVGVLGPGQVGSALLRQIEAQHLAQSPARPVLQSEAVNVDGEGRPTHHTIAVFAGDRVQMIVQPDEADVSL